MNLISQEGQSKLFIFYYFQKLWKRLKPMTVCAISKLLSYEDQMLIYCRMQPYYLFSQELKVQGYSCYQRTMNIQEIVFFIKRFCFLSERYKTTSCALTIIDQINSQQLLNYNIIILIIFLFQRMFRGREQNENLESSKMSQSHVKTIEPQSQTIQKQVDCYTRKLQEQKRRLFRAQQNHKEALEDYQARVSSLQKLKTKKYKNQISAFSSKIKLLEKGLQKNISTYNQALSKNNQLKNEIDELRKDRRNQMQSYNCLSQKMEEMNSSMDNVQKNIDQKKNKIDKYKSDILTLRRVNEQQHEFCLGNISTMTEKMRNTTNLRQTLRNSNNKQKTQNSDTQPIYKLRLRNLIHKNKQKIKIMELYKKNMQKIQNSFQEIQQESGISNLQEISDIFLKQQQQNTFILEYINKLTNDLQMIRENNNQLKDKIESQEKVNNDYRNVLSCTPQQREASKQIHRFLQQKNKPIDKTNKFLSGIKNKLFDLLNVSNEEYLTSLNIEQYLAKVEDLINQKCMMILTPEISQNKDDMLTEYTTKYCKPAPTVGAEQLKDKSDQGIMEEGRLREYATEFLEKKKLGRV